MKRMTWDELEDAMPLWFFTILIFWFIAHSMLNII